ncbi:hypothetical protein B0H13DRAFT_2074408 [Mycena leptocephala]|nr:hypothetical protein B0H13DRAFT_2074408 [Mycena leptocephala]
MALESHVLLLRVLFVGCATMGGRIFYASRRYHSSSISFTHTLTSLIGTSILTSAAQQRQCRGRSLSPQRLSFASGKLTLK